MKLLSVNVGRPRPVPHGGKLVETAIFKEPFAGPVMVRSTNLEGDRQADLVNHGGEHKAVYAYDHAMYDYWRRELSRDDFTFGQFGENLTVEGMPDDEVCIGDVCQIGTARLQVTQPRAPCFKLGIRMSDPGIVKKFLQTCRVGFYLRVLEEGRIEAGEEIALIERGPQQISVMQTCRLMYFDKGNVDDVRRLLQEDALSPAWREPLARRLTS